VSALLDDPAARRLVGDLLPRCAFPEPGTSVDCAVSGGADSSALLVLAVAAGCDVTAWHVDHGLRPGSAEEAGVVARLAHSVGARFESRRVTVADGPNLEARARAARLGTLPEGTLTGHTADDQAETVLINLLRGAGARGLAGMRPGGTHPILALRRSETHAVCDALGIDVVDDPTNVDRRHLRNRIRHDVLPSLEAVAGRDIVPMLCRLADLSRDDDDLLDGLSASIDPTDARALAAAPAPLARRAVRRWLTDRLPPDAATIERVLQVARGQAGACDVGRGRSVERSRMRLRIVEPPQNPDTHYE